MTYSTSHPFLGVIGGMGPAATADFLAKLAAVAGAKRDQDHVPVLVWGDCRVPERTAALAGNSAAVCRYLVAAAKGLAAIGAVALTIPCNTAHAWATDIEAASPIRLLHVVDAVLASVHRIGARRIGLMATQGTLAAGFYERRLAVASIDIVKPSEIEQSAVDYGIGLVKAGNLAEARTILLTVLNSLRTQNVDVVALACTELPIVMAQEADVLDVTRSLAEYASVWWSSNYGLTSERAE